VTLSKKGLEPVTTEFFDLWQLDENGKVTSLVQLGGTALVARLMG